MGVNEIVREVTAFAAGGVSFIARLLRCPLEMAGNVPSVAICEQAPLNTKQAVTVVSAACALVGVRKFVMVTVTVLSLA